MRLASILALVALTTLCTAAQAAPAATTAPAAAVAKPSKVNFDIPLTPLKQKDLNFGLFRNRWTLLFYFSPTCGHCQHSYPTIQKFRTAYEKKGLAFAAIVSGSASQDDIRMFDADYKLDMPSFQDATRQFGQAYGTGSVPLLLLVKPDGSFQSWVGFNDSTSKVIEASIKSGLHIK